MELSKFMHFHCIYNFYYFLIETFQVQGSRFFIICHIHNHTSIISSEMQVELKKNNKHNMRKVRRKK